MEALHVFSQTKDIELLMVRVPVAAYPFKATGTIIERIGHHTDLCLLDRDNLAVEEGKTIVGHGLFPF
jgi:hypothetical protein